MVTTLFPLTLDAVEIRRRGNRLLGPISLTLGEFGTTVILGPNGAGKTTFLRMLHGLERLSAGHLNWACTAAEANRHQTFVFQTPILLRRSVLENVTYPLRLRGCLRSEAKSRARETLLQVGLEAFAEHPAARLSGGEKQKLALGRALATDPKVLFLDEPCSALDGKSMRDIEGILAATRARGTRIIMSTHDLGQARRLADDILFLTGGHLCEKGQASPFFNAPKTREARAFLRGDIVE